MKPPGPDNPTGRPPSSGGGEGTADADPSGTEMKPGPCTINRVIQDERKAIVRRREVAFPEGPQADQRWTEENVAENLVGLALSGGGIRSAMFNLGLLQALHRSGLLRYADYLSTVSGGGYVGAHLSSLPGPALGVRQPLRLRPVSQPPPSSRSPS
jgi:hypothetical protein